MSSKTIVRISESGGITHVSAVSEASTSHEALTSVQNIFDWIGSGKRRFVRVMPTAKSERLFEINEIKYQGHVRFSFSDEAGEDEMIAQECEQLVTFGIGGEA